MSINIQKVCLKQKLYNEINKGRAYEWGLYDKNIKNYIYQLMPVDYAKGFHILTTPDSVRGKDLYELLTFIESTTLSTSTDLVDKINALPNWDKTQTNSAIIVLCLMLHSRDINDQNYHFSSYKDYSIMKKVDCLMGTRCPYWHYCDNNFINGICEGNMNKFALSLSSNKPVPDPKIQAHSSAWNHN